MYSPCLNFGGRDSDSGNNTKSNVIGIKSDINSTESSVIMMSNTKQEKTPKRQSGKQSAAKTNDRFVIMTNEKRRKRTITIPFSFHNPYFDALHSGHGRGYAGGKAATQKSPLRMSHCPRDGTLLRSDCRTQVPLPIVSECTLMPFSECGTARILLRLNG